MTLFLTSSPCWDEVPEGCDLPCVFNEANGFVDNLREFVEPGDRLLVVASDPDSYDRLEEAADTFAGCFAWHGMPMSGVELLDHRNADQAEELIAGADVILLSGGHVPTQNAFFQEIGLRELLEGFDGVVIGVSAGSMNCAEVVYAQPELPGESIDPDYERFLPGLALTGVNILPHYNQEKDSLLDGRRLYEDITFEDSEDNLFFVLVDGSYILSVDGEERLFGEAYIIHDGEMEPICDEGDDIPLED